MGKRGAGNLSGVAAKIAVVIIDVSRGGRCEGKGIGRGKSADYGESPRFALATDVKQIFWQEMVIQY